VWRDLFRAGPRHADGVVLIDQAIAAIRKAGAVVVDPIATGRDLFNIPSTAGTNTDEAKFAFNLYFSRLGPDAPIRSVDELLVKGGALVRPYIVAAAEISSLNDRQTYFAKLETRAMLRRLAVELMDRYQLDALIYPFKTVPASRAGSKRLRRTASRRGQLRRSLVRSSCTEIRGPIHPGEEKDHATDSVDHTCVRGGRRHPGASHGRATDLPGLRAAAATDQHKPGSRVCLLDKDVSGRAGPRADCNRSLVGNVGFGRRSDELCRVGNKLRRRKELV
jgi:hypothetical protein